MLNVNYILIILMIIIGIIGCIMFILIYKNYINRRLNGEGRIRRLPQPLTFFIITALIISIACNIIFITSLNKPNQDYQELIEKTFPRSIIVTDFEQYPEYAEFRDELTNNSLSGYNIRREVDGDFECLIAFPKGKINNAFFMPQYFVYIRYIGESLGDAQMERWYSYDEAGHGWGSSGQFKPETLIIGTTLEENLYLAIKTIIKIAPEITETKENWDSLPIYSEAYFIVSHYK